VTRAGRFIRGVCLEVALGSSGCTLLNDIDVCGTSLPEHIVNQLTNRAELITSTSSVASIEYDRILVAFVAAGGGEPHAVRIVIQDAATGTPQSACGVPNRSELELGAGELVSVAAVDSPRADRSVVAAIGWVEALGTEPAPRGLLRFIGTGGCPVGSPLVLSPNIHDGDLHLLSTGHPEFPVAALLTDTRTVRLVLVAESRVVRTLDLARENSVLASHALGLASNRAGTMLAAWLVQTSLSRGEIAVHASLFSEADLASPSAMPPDVFTLPFPVGFAPTDGGAPNLAVVAQGSEFLIALSAARSRLDPHELWVQRIDAKGKAVGAPIHVDEQREARMPTLIELDSARWMVGWATATQHRAQVFTRAGDASFQTLTCSAESFTIGDLREGVSVEVSGLATALAAGRLWFVRSASHISDGTETAVVASSVELERLLGLRP